MTQKRLQGRARDKFGEFADGMLFTPDGLEQASRLEVAATHAGRYAAASLATVHDLGCGIGSDAMAMSALGVTVHGVDADPLTAAIADVNLRPWPDSRARTGVAEDFEAPLDPPSLPRRRVARPRPPHPGRGRPLRAHPTGLPARRDLTVVGLRALRRPRRARDRGQALPVAPPRHPTARHRGPVDLVAGHRPRVHRLVGAARQGGRPVRPRPAQGGPARRGRPAHLRGGPRRRALPRRHGHLALRGRPCGHAGRAHRHRHRRGLGHRARDRPGLRHERSGARPRPRPPLRGPRGDALHRQGPARLAARARHHRADGQEARDPARRGPAAQAAEDRPRRRVRRERDHRAHARRRRPSCPRRAPGCSRRRLSLPPRVSGVGSAASRSTAGRAADPDRPHRRGPRVRRLTRSPSAHRRSGRRQVSPGHRRRSPSAPRSSSRSAGSWSPSGRSSSSTSGWSWSRWRWCSSTCCSTMSSRWRSRSSRWRSSGSLP
ncbi:hypothetical protein B277_01499 [Janibacter hoylei PVAS-1]|uniref:Uncharacterized protein n=1 Tax=Janibacter hoylei PVAS-1 TaxID=1210046 RepID=K1E5Y4_9MICO|nr:hypothetical protein B277_01499 [Janibacter hoylei PVAS-1]